MKLLTTMLFVCIFVSTPLSLRAEAPTTAEPEKIVEFSIAPYAWLTSMEGSVTASGVKADVDLSFAEINRRTSFAGMLAAGALFYNKFGITGNINVAFLEDQKYHNGARLSGETDLIVGDLTALYRIGTYALGEGAAPFVNVDLLAGARFWDVSLKLDLDTQHFGSHSVSRSRNWVDPIVGVRTDFRLDERWRILLQGGVGGGGKTHSTWDAYGVVGYNFWRNASVLAGYKAVGINRREDSGNDRFVFDVTIHGPILGLLLTF